MAMPANLSEIDWTRRYALGAIAVATAFMILLNTTGAWIASKNPFYTGVIAGVEMLEIVCLVLTLRAPTLARRIVGGLIMAAVVYVCVENGKMAIRESFKDVFAGENGQALSPKALREKAKTATTEAGELAKSAPTDRQAIKTEIAELKVFLKKMSAMTPEGIKEAQSEMIGRCNYTGRVDGIRSVLTESAMRACGERINNRLDTLQAMDSAPAAPASLKSNEATDLIAKADEIDSRTVWMDILLLAIAGVQAAGIWAFIDWTEKKPAVRVDPNVFRDLQEQADELARRKANLAEGAEKAVGTKTKKKKKEEAIVANVKAVEDLRAKVDQTSVPLHEDAGDDVQTPGQIEAATESDPEPEAPLTEDAGETDAEPTEGDDQRPLRAAE